MIRLRTLLLALLLPACGLLGGAESAVDAASDGIAFAGAAVAYSWTSASVDALTQCPSSDAKRAERLDRARRALAEAREALWEANAADAKSFPGQLATTAEATARAMAEVEALGLRPPAEVRAGLAAALLRAAGDRQ